MAAKPTYRDLEKKIEELEKSIAELNPERTQLNQGLNSTVRTIDSEKDIRFEDLFDIPDIQNLQDLFAKATGVASLITTTDGKPITKPSNFCRLCRDIIRQSEKGQLNCCRSDTEIGKLNISGPTIQPCLSGGLWDSGAGISVGGKHLANWLMGQVRDENQDEAKIRAYAREIEVDEEDAVKAFFEVPSMPKEKYQQISQFLFTLANQLSQLAFLNVQQARAITRLEQSEKRLRQSEAHYRTLIETIPDLVWVKDLEGKFICCNNEFERFIGKSEAEIKGKTDYDFVHRELADFFRHHDRKAIEQNGPSFNEEWLTYAGNGYRGLYETVKTPLRDSTGEVVGVLGVARDISKIKEKEHELRQIFDMSLDMICIIDLQTATLKKVNPAFTRTLGYSEEDLLTRPLREFIHPGDVDDSVRVVRDELQKGNEIYNYNNRSVCKNGDIKWLSWVAHAQPETGLAYGIARDITEELAVSKALQESEQRFRSIIESSPMGIVTCELTDDDRLVLTGVNEATNQILGRECSKLVGIIMEEAFPILLDIKILDRYRAICRGGPAWHSEKVEVEYKDGRKPGTFEVHAFQSIPNNATIIFMDITARIENEKEREVLQEKLSHTRKMDAIGQLAGGIAHDFNNMLGGIKGAAELLEFSLQDKPETIKYIEMINTATDRTSSLINKLLAFSRKGKQISTPVNVHTVLQDAVILLERSIDKRVRIETAYGSKQFDVIGDPAQLQNCFLNLFINARDAMPDGGSLLIATRNIQIDETSVLGSSLPPGEYIVISVQDTGKGISPDLQAQIFEPFFTTKEVGKGTGLGLASVYGIVKEHHGDIRVYSEPGVGTNFEIIFPVITEQKSYSASYKGHAIHGSGTILLVDDEDIIRTAGTLLLKQLGYSVIQAENGEKAVQVYRDHIAEIDLVILDIVMPVMDGREAYKQIRLLNPEVKVIISSGFTRDISMIDVIKEGRAGFIMKPFNSVELSKLIAESLEDGGMK